MLRVYCFVHPASAVARTMVRLIVLGSSAAVLSGRAASRSRNCRATSTIECLPPSPLAPFFRCQCVCFCDALHRSARQTLALLALGRTSSGRSTWSSGWSRRKANSVLLETRCKQPCEEPTFPSRASRIRCQPARHSAPIWTSLFNSSWRTRPLRQKLLETAETFGNGRCNSRRSCPLEKVGPTTALDPTGPYPPSAQRFFARHPSLRGVVGQRYGKCCFSTPLRLRLRRYPVRAPDGRIPRGV